MELKGERLIPASIQQTWAALNNPEILQACITGCESLALTGDNAYQAVVAVKVGPVSARFKGNVQMSQLNPPNGYTLNFDGQGGVAGFGKGSADVVLKAEGPQTRLSYDAKAQVGGKLAQIGSRLVDATAAKMTDDFFSAFDAALRAQVGAAPAEPPAPAATSGGVPTWAWVAGAALAAAILYFLTR
jgi:uncharacterized protein